MSSGGAGGEAGVRGWEGRQGGKGNKGACRLRIGSWNIGTLTGKSIELAKVLQKRKVNIDCVQETRCVGSKAKDADEYKVWYSRVVKGKNEVGILVDKDLRDTYAPQEGLDEEAKRRLWEGLDEIVHSTSPAGRLFIGGDFNGHIGSSSCGYGEVHGGFNFRVRNAGGALLLEFAKAFELVIANFSFSKREEHLVTFQSMVAKTQIDYFLLRMCDRGLCEDHKVIPGRRGCRMSGGGVWWYRCTRTKILGAELLRMMKAGIEVVVASHIRATICSC
nr:uncharacterized protein LOC104113838 [Nicotiana tomentosiformis]